MKIDGLPVVDAKKRVRLHILAKDIKKGKTKNPSSCAAARACVRQLNCSQARVHLGRTYLLMGKKWVRYNTPHSIRSEIISFDRGATFEAGTYTMPPPQPSRRGGQKRQGSDAKATYKSKRAKPHVMHNVRVNGSLGTNKEHA